MIDENYPIFGVNLTNPDGVIARLQAIQNDQYTIYDREVIVRTYVHHCRIARVDWVALVGQMCHETEWLRTFWAARPRRNPAGIGVTGHKSAIPPPIEEINLWQRNGDIWEYGLSFASWEQAVQVHIGHMLCYGYRDKYMTAEQLRYSNLSPRKDKIPLGIRGKVTTLRGLNGKWAVPGTTYGANIAKKINYLLKGI